MLSNIPPDQANEMLKNGGYTGGCLIDSEPAARILGLEYHGISKTKPSYDTIAETNYYKSSGVPQHFFIIKADGSQVDPLGKSIVYPIVSYRLFKGKDNMNGLKLWDNNGQVWAEFDNKQFYVENPKSIEGLSIVKGQPSGDILIKQKDQDARLAQLRAEMQGQIDARDVQINGLNSKVEQLKKQNSDLVTRNSELSQEVESMHELLEDCQSQKDDCVIQKDKLQKQIDEHKCEVKEMTAWEHFKMFISKLIERK
ncbi:MAG: hypothetical protein ACOYJ1_14610 [Peptococcales bacterium]